ncbi:MAG: tetratricopeptide repeat protein [Oceanidesulfovibrio sp.]
MHNHTLCSSSVALLACILLAAFAAGCAGVGDLADGTVQLQNDEYDAAIDSFTQALGHEKMLASARADALMLRGEAYLEQGKADKALADLNESLEIDPTDLRALTLRGRARMQKGDLDAATVDFRTVVQSFDRRAVASAINRRAAAVPEEYARLAGRSHVGLGEIALYQERYQDALDHFDAAVGLAPYEPDFYLMRGGALQLMEQEEFAEQDLATFEELSSNATHGPESLLAPLKLKESILLFEAGEYAASERLAGEAIEVNPNYPAAYRRRGLARLQQGELEKAEADFDEAIAGEPYNMESWLYRSYTRMERGNHEDALTDINHVLGMRPEWLEARLYRGMVLSESGRHLESLEDFEAVLEERPDDVTALEGRAFSLFNAEQYDKAMADLQRLRELAPDAAMSYRLAGLIHLKNEQFRQALESLDTAERLGDESLQLYVAKGSALRALGEEEQAAAMFDKALDASKKAGETMPSLE